MKIMTVVITAAAVAAGLYAVGYVDSEGWARNEDGTEKIPGGAATVAAGGVGLLAANSKGDTAKLATVAAGAALAPMLLSKVTEAASDHRQLPAPSPAAVSYNNAAAELLSPYLDGARA
jgi:hypothetical protein